MIRFLILFLALLSPQRPQIKQPFIIGADISGVQAAEDRGIRYSDNGTQRDVLAEVRSRTATLLTASSIVTSFVGGRAIDAAGLDVLTVAAVIAFFVTLVPAIYIVTGSAEGSFSIDGSRLYADLAPMEALLEEAYVALAEEIRDVRGANRSLIDRVLWCLRLGFGALILEVTLFLAALAVD